MNMDLVKINNYLSDVCFIRIMLFATLLFKSKSIYVVPELINFCAE